MDNNSKTLQKIREVIKSKNSSITESELDKSSKLIMEKLEEKRPIKKDENGYIIVAENVRVVLNSGISSATEIKS